ncbi:hypothetical protein [Teredinibacter franksiae]|uniref:hypothetical protein n=1 Tax=Teredinibacter franksiae TaxID=2761453 RepID=UPI0016272182|nr:hypothetical protein [Teredinibacter franksiae]
MSLSSSVTEKVTERWDGIAAKFAALQQREKILLAAGVLLSVYLVWELAFAGDLNKRRDALVKRFEAANVQLKTLSTEEKMLVVAINNDPNAAKRRTIVRLEKQLQAANKKLQEMSVGLLSADQLPQVLHDVLRESDQLELVGMESKAPVKLQLAQEKREPTGQSEEDEAVALAEDLYEEDQARYVGDERMEEERIIGVYKHSVKITLKGEYFSVIAYLQKLEALNWKLFWENIEYQVDRYPGAVVTLEVYTLSTDRGVLGV